MRRRKGDDPKIPERREVSLQMLKEDEGGEGGDKGMQLHAMMDVGYEVG
jgi:hypothetical protein